MSANLISKKKYCNNCGREGHLFAECNDPITSMGIICIRVSDPEVHKLLISQFHSNDKKMQVNIQKTNNCHMNDVRNISKYMDKIQFLMVQRKCSLGYIEFIRGRYDVSDYHHIIRLFQQMQQWEINQISMWNFDKLWSDLWKGTANLKIYKHDYEQSKAKFEKLVSANDTTENIPMNQSDKILGLNFYVKTIEPTYSDAEWGFPKGRRNFYESGIQCSCREFTEETGYTSSSFTVLNSLLPLIETFKGTNQIDYRHMYYISIMNEPGFDDSTSTPQDNLEIGDVKWFSFQNAIEHIRGYHTAKIAVLNDLFRFNMFLFDKLKQDSKDNIQLYGVKQVYSIQSNNMEHD